MHFQYLAGHQVQHCQEGQTNVNAELEKEKEAPTGRTVEDAKSMKDEQTKRASSTGETIHIQGNHHTLNKTPKRLIPQSAKMRRHWHSDGGGNSWLLMPTHLSQPEFRWWKANVERIKSISKVNQLANEVRKSEAEGHTLNYDIAFVAKRAPFLTLHGSHVLTLREPKSSKILCQS
ncbi:hypothetical protein MJT46_008756 [Ovis ammon polii x Ovis aries]|nr:hypothetical protein MJT46_008756 [Ovis ammon polii x Ovis aries]